MSFVPGETHEIVIHKEPEWGNDSDNPRGKVIEVWEMDRKNTKEGPIQNMHLRMSTDKDYITGGNGNWRTEPVDVDMASVEKGLRILAGTGGPYWPGMIEPLALDKIYGVTRRNSDEDEDFVWIAYLAWMPISSQNAKVVAPPPMESGGVETEKLLGGCPPTPCSTEFLVSYRDVWVINIEGKEWWVAKDNGELIEAINLPNGSLQHSGLREVQYDHTKREESE